MEIVFTYLPIRLKEVTEIYLGYSIKKLNEQGIVPLIYSDSDYFIGRGMKYEWIEFNIEERYKRNNLWSYPKLKVLSSISFPFIHLDNDLIVNDLDKLNSIIDSKKLNLCYKHELTEGQINDFIELYKMYSNNPLDFKELNNTSIIASNNYTDVNKTFQDVLQVIDLNYDFFTKRYNNIPPITLNQQHLNRYFKDINYLFRGNPSFIDLESNGVCHIDEKNLPRFLIKDLI